MERDIDTRAYGIAAFDILRRLLPKMLEDNLITKTDLLAVLDNIARQEATRGVASDNDANTDAALLAAKLAIDLRH